MGNRLAESESSYGLSAGHISATWSYDASSKTTYAFVVARTSNYETKDVFFDYLQSMKDLSQVPAYLPYIIASLEVASLTKSVVHSERGAKETGLHLIRMLYQQEPIQAFSAKTVQMETLLHMRKFTPFVIEMARQSNFAIPHNHTVITTKTGNQPCCIASHNDLVLAALSFRAQELTSLLAGIEALQRHATHHVSSILGMITFHQQDTAQEISKATLKDSRMMKEIAEATKKDSTSMKVLAVITVIFLPSTAISAILAIPNMFGFDSDSNKGGGWLVNRNFWVFLAISIPLTLIVVALMWCWLKWEGKGRPIPWLRPAVKDSVSWKETKADKIV